MAVVKVKSFQKYSNNDFEFGTSISVIISVSDKIFTAFVCIFLFIHVYVAPVFTRIL